LATGQPAVARMSDVCGALSGADPTQLQAVQEHLGAGSGVSMSC
jgi:hypothetical protein